MKSTICAAIYPIARTVLMFRVFISRLKLTVPLEGAAEIWIVIVSATAGVNDSSPYHHTEALTQKLHMNPQDNRKFRHEYLFEWEISDHYVGHKLSVDTLLNRGLNLDLYLDVNGHLPDLQGFRCLMMDTSLRIPLDGYDVGRELGQMAALAFP